ncbi:MAG: transglycosylase domain-containing protein [Bacteroidia bacterium]|nr:transglycosylase domain-containing protein [Bacteroidia bacterium]
MAPQGAPLSPVFYDAEGRVIHVGLSQDGKWRLPPSPLAVKRIAPLLLYKEDRYFWWHFGIFPPALVRAAWYSFIIGKRQGGSTLTMQLARLWRPKKNFLLRKFTEIITAVSIELRHSKSEIVSFYLTYAPFGGNVEGIETAAQVYFGKSAELLTPLEVGALLLLVQRPALVGRFLRGDSSFYRSALKWVACWYEAGLVSRDAYEQALRTPLIARWRSLPRLAPYLLPAHADRGDTLYLRLAFQKQLEQLLQQEVERQRLCGVRQGAILVAEVSTGKVIAYVPSDSYRKCAIDLIQVQRSVGSTLKPLLWAQALNEGKIHSETPLLDVPRPYGGYVPLNFEREKYRGLVSATQALILSLNAPAVELLERVGIHRFSEQGRLLNLHGLEKGRYASIVGAAEASLWRLLEAYTALASGGNKVKLRRWASESVDRITIWDSAASWIVSNILKKEDGWSYKTGTSSYLRDAWCIAYDSRYLVGVWLGNPDGSSSGCLRGREAAMPLARRVTRLLGVGIPLSLPTSVERLWVCPLTGQRVGPLCPDSILAWRRKQSSPLPLCQHQRQLWSDGQYTYCEACRPMQADSMKVLRFLPLPWALLTECYLPPHAPHCQSTSVDILSPLSHTTIWLAGSRLPLQAVASPLSPILWGKDSDTIGWQAAGSVLWYSLSEKDTLLHLWAQVGRVRKHAFCRIIRYRKRR